jgi:DNA-binding beta-propeller fold protein YncE
MQQLFGSERSARAARGGYRALLLIFAIGAAVAARPAPVLVAQSASLKAPTYEFDVTWPKPLPNHWILGQVSGVSVDSRGHIWIIHRPSTIVQPLRGAERKPPTAICCMPAPPVLEFDQQGNVLRHWGGPGEGYEWPELEHGILVDQRDNVWISGNGNKDDQLLKFTADGKFVMQIGHSGQSKGSNDIENLGRPAEMYVDPVANEIYVADGYGNRRVIVFDTETGKYKRHWGAYGHMPEDPPPAPAGGRGRAGGGGPQAFPLPKPGDPTPQQMGTVHCVTISKDGLVYVCDRNSHRIQVFKKDGTFVKEVFLGKDGWPSGISIIRFTPDPQQRFLLGVDLTNERIDILVRDTLDTVAIFGTGGHRAGDWDVPHGMDSDSKGNIYVGEVNEGKRVQRFLYHAPR